MPDASTHIVPANSRDTSVQQSEEFRIEEIRDSARLASLSGEWNDLLLRSPRPDLYRSHEWMTTWWQCHADAKKSLLVLLVRDKSGLRGIAPLMEVRTLFAGMPATKLEFLTTMRHAYSPVNCSASLDMIVSDPIQPVHRAIIRYLLDVRRGWHLLRFHPVPESSPLPAILEEECRRRGLGFRSSGAFTNYAVDVAGTWEDYERTRPADSIKKRRAADRRMEKTGPASLTEYGSPDDIAEGYRKVLEIEHRSWKSSDGIPLDAPVYRGFYESFARVAAARGWLKLWILEAAGRPIAYDYSVVFRRRVEALKTSYDAEFHSSSPGTGLTWKVFEQYFRNGVEAINLLWGDGWSKKLWTTSMIPHVELFAAAPSRYASLLWMLGIRMELYRASRSFENRTGRRFRRTKTLFGI
jgi:hypothetical protein